jgi:hypothetical protein
MQIYTKRNVLTEIYTKLLALFDEGKGETYL